MTGEDRPKTDAADAGDGMRGEARTGPPNGDEDDRNGGGAERTQRPLLVGVIGLLAGIAGGIAGTTLAPSSLVLTIVLVIGVAGVVTLAALGLLARR